MGVYDWIMINLLAVLIMVVIYCLILALPDLIWPIKDAIERLKRIFK